MFSFCAFYPISLVRADLSSSCVLKHCISCYANQPHDLFVFQNSITVCSGCLCQHFFVCNVSSVVVKNEMHKFVGFNNVPRNDVKRLTFYKVVLERFCQNCKLCSYKLNHVSLPRWVPLFWVIHHWILNYDWSESDYFFVSCHSSDSGASFNSYHRCHV